MALGTREIAAYQFPEYTFDKILYVEKEGELPKLQAAKLGERYDMAICSGKGQPTEAVRTSSTAPKAATTSYLCSTMLTLTATISLASWPRRPGACLATPSMWWTSA